MCARQSLKQLSGKRGAALFSPVPGNPDASPRGERSGYRVLRGVRRRTLRSVDRKSAGRNAAVSVKEVEPRQSIPFEVAERVWSSEGSTSIRFDRIWHLRGPRPWHVLKAVSGTWEISSRSSNKNQGKLVAPRQGLTSKSRAMPDREVRCARSSENREAQGNAPNGTTYGNAKEMG